MKKYLKIAFSVILVISLLCSSLTGCNTSKEKNEVSIIMAPYFGSWMCTYGIQSGAVTSDKVDVKVDMGLDFDAQMLAGNYKIGAMNTSQFATAVSNDLVDLKAMCVYLAHAGVEKTNGVAVLYVKKGSNIKSVKDLVGKTVGVPGVNSGVACSFFGMINDDFNIKSTDMTIIDQPAIPLLLQLLNNGDVDAALVQGDPAVQAYYSGAYDIIWNEDQEFETKYNTFNPASVIAVDSDFYKNNKETVEAVYELLEESRDYGIAHMDELINIYVEQNGYDASMANVYKKAYTEHYSAKVAEISGNVEDAVMAVFNYVKFCGIINNIPAPKDIFIKW